MPTGGTITSPLLVLVGLGADPDPLTVRRAAGAAARAVTNSASVALALPADTPELVRSVLEGYRLGGYTFTRYKSGADASTPAEIVVLSPAARRKEAIAAFDEAQLVADAVVAARDWVNTPPGDLTPALFADEIVAAREAGRRRQGQGATTKHSSPSSAAAASSASAPDRQLRRAWSSWTTGRPSRPAPRPTWRSSARASPSTPAGSPSSPPPACRR